MFRFSLIGSTVHPLISGLIMVVAIAACSTGCAGGYADNRVTYAVTAKENYQQGKEKLKAKAWQGAAKYFTFVKARFPYSKYAVISELRLADSEFGAENYLQAIAGFKTFAKLHPTHNMVVNGYAAFRMGEAYYRTLPGDWWLLPPSYEKDQSTTTDAHRQFSAFLRKYPKSPYYKKAKKRLASINRRLADHEMYVAQYYWQRGRAMGTVLRLRRLLDKHQGTELDAPAMYLLGEAYIKVSMPKRAREIWEELIATHPTHKQARQARQALGQPSG